MESHFESSSQISNFVAPSMSKILPLSVRHPLPDIIDTDPSLVKSKSFITEFTDVDEIRVKHNFLCAMGE